MTRSRRQKFLANEVRANKNRLKKEADRRKKQHRRNMLGGEITYTNARGAVISFKNLGEYVRYKEKMKEDGISELNLTHGKILVPTKPSHFEIQAYVYSSLLQMGVDVRGEVRAKNKAGKASGLDLVIFEGYKPVMILEIKKSKRNRIDDQKEEYTKFGVPLRFIMGMKSAEAYIEKVRFNLKKIA